MNKRIKLFISANQGYSADQVNRTITVGELREILENFDDDMEIVTYNCGQQYGAKFGRILTDEPEECDCEECDD